MEKGFNDDELADIMNEIESLEKEFSADMQEKTEQDQTETIESKDEKSDFEEEFKMEKEAPSAHDHTESEITDEEVHEVLGELSKMDAEEVTPTSIKHEDKTFHSEESNVRHLTEAKTHHEDHDHKESHQGAHTSMSFHVEGDMKFDLSFHIGGQFVGLTVTEEGLEIGLEGGAKFTVPVKEVSAVKKAS